MEVGRLCALGPLGPQQPREETAASWASLGGGCGRVTEVAKVRGRAVSLRLADLSAPSAPEDIFKISAGARILTIYKTSCTEYCFWSLEDYSQKLLNLNLFFFNPHLRICLLI